MVLVKDLLKIQLLVNELVVRKGVSDKLLYLDGVALLVFVHAVANQTFDVFVGECEEARFSAAHPEEEGAWFTGLGQDFVGLDPINEATESLPFGKLLEVLPKIFQTEETDELVEFVSGDNVILWKVDQITQALLHTIREHLFPSLKHFILDHDDNFVECYIVDIAK